MHARDFVVQENELSSSGMEEESLEPPRPLPFLSQPGSTLRRTTEIATNMKHLSSRALFGVAMHIIDMLRFRGEAHQLLKMEDHRLADIGLTRDDVMHALCSRDPRATLAASYHINTSASGLTPLPNFGTGQAAANLGAELEHDRQQAGENEPAARMAIGGQGG